MNYSCLRESYRNAVASIISRAPPKVHHRFHPASEEELEILQALELPESIELFYEEFVPDGEIGVCGNEEDGVLLPIEGIEWYNDCPPGLHLKPFGYLTFATTCSGDHYCFDLAHLNDAGDCPIVLLSHEIDYDDKTEAEVAGHAKFVASSLLELLNRW